MFVLAPYTLIASMDVDREREELFNRVYDEEHIPNLLQVPGVLSVVRYEQQSLTMILAGERHAIRLRSPKYHAVYGLESPNVLVSDAWARAVDLGAWAQDVRPYTRNRRHWMMKRLGV